MSNNISFFDPPGNFNVEITLLNNLKRKSTIAFVGSGASAELYGTWNTLINYLIDKAVESGCADIANKEFWLSHINTRPHQVARLIKNKFSDIQIFNNLLAEYFKPKVHPETNKYYTPLHRAIVNLPFKGVITTNYDVGIFEALRTCRPDVSYLQYETWQDAGCVNQWRTGDIFEDNNCPLLHAHGVWSRPETIILDNDSYRRAYNENEPYSRMFENLWATQRLVIIGFGFSDSWLEHIMDGILTPILHGVGTRHIAILGFHEKDKNLIGEYRSLLQNAYNAQILFYPIKSKMVNGKATDDHGELVNLLLRLKLALLEAETTKSITPPKNIKDDDFKFRPFGLDSST
jgi:hypothetical protein